MYTTVFDWFLSIGLNKEASHVFTLLTLFAGVFLFCLLLKIIIDLIINRIIRKYLHKRVVSWESALAKSGFFRRLTFIALPIFLYFAADWFVNIEVWVRRIALALLVFIFARVLDAVMSAMVAVYDDYEISKRKPIRGFVQVAQLLIWTAAIILILSSIMGYSPWVLIGGLGAFSAVLLLVFKDTLLGLFAAAQFVSNDMFRIGDWVELPQYDIDGEVIEITVTTVKIRNWDKTISTLPTYTLLAEPVRNWRGMQLSGGRRMNRTVLIDLFSIQVCDAELLERLSKKYPAVVQYMQEKNNPPYINLDLYRCAAEHYLGNHPLTHKQMTILVSQQAPTAQGMPVDFIAFCTDQTIVNYSAYQAEIITHLIIMLADFELMVYQRPSGTDFMQ